jgi:GT2 family glycosyltransferase/glycosyltransferase involved in cell wall biosynthesis
VRDIDTAIARARAAWDTGERLAAEGDLAGGLAWLGRAHRMAPSDQNLRFALARLRLLAGEAEAAAALFGDLARRHGVRECWVGLAAACLAAGRVTEAVAAAGSALSSCTADTSSAGIARRVVRQAGLPGWCGTDGAGALLADSDAPLTILLDGQPTAAEAAGGGRFLLPPDWQQAATLSVSAAGATLLGSPIALTAIRHLEGFVERTEDGLAGWAWHPAAPERPARLRVLEGAKVVATLTAEQPLQEVDGSIPLARPREFRFPLPHLRPVRVVGENGRDLLGSPLAPPPAPSRPRRSARTSLPVPEDRLISLAVDIVIPVYRGLRTTLDCIDSVLATVPQQSRVWVVDDASPEPELVEAVGALAARGLIGLIRPAAGRRGFPAAVNAGMRAAADRHVLLLNSDTLVAPGWVEGLRAAACSAPDIGTATPLSNQASIFSYPDVAGDNPAPDRAGTTQIAERAAHANAGRIVEVPTANGFCMFIRADCRRQTGFFEEDLFAQGYGEENDFTERARALGWRHIAVPSVFVAHLGGVSFGTARHHLLRRNLGLLEQRHPGYRARVEKFLDLDPLHPARRRLDAAGWQQAGSDTAEAGSVLLVTHGGGGGTARIVAERAAAIRARGLRPVVLRAVEGTCVVGEAAGGFPNLSFVLPRELAALRRLLAAGRPREAELHHLLGHDHSILDLLRQLEIPFDVWVHDYAWFCPRLSFVTGEGRFCGEADSRTCDACVGQWGRAIEDPVAPAELRRRSATDLRAARTVIVPSQDVARRVARHAPGVSPTVRPWHPDPPYAPPSLSGTASAARGGALRVAVVGAIGLEKGFDMLLACARDAAARALALSFVVVGYSSDDDALLQTGRVFVTGEFARAEATDLIRAQMAGLAFLPSIWPETWCYALTDVWDAGLSAVVFDIGTPAARVRQTGRGWVLPLGLPPDQVNDALLALYSQSAEAASSKTSERPFFF